MWSPPAWLTKAIDRECWLFVVVWRPLARVKRGADLRVVALLVLQLHTPSSLLTGLAAPSLPHVARLGIRAFAWLRGALDSIDLASLGRCRVLRSGHPPEAAAAKYGNETKTLRKPQ
jgi:hypothetical protein